MAQGAHDPDVERWRPLVERYFRPKDVDYAMMVMWATSAGNPAAVSEAAGQVGLYQLNMAKWTDTITAVRAFYAARGIEIPYNIWDPEAQIATAAFLVSQTASDPKYGGWRNWPTATRYYPPGSWKPGVTYWDGDKYVNVGSTGGGQPPKGKGQAAGSPGGLLVPNAELGQGFLVPIAGAATPGPGSQFGDARTGHTHAGVDYSAQMGTMIMASQSGVVVFSGYLNGSAGRAVVVRHPNGWTTHYFHCDSELVRVGDQVGAGQPIATVGQTGNAEGPHVHFETRVNGTPVDPLSLNMQTTGEMPDLMTAEQSRQIGPNVQTFISPETLYQPRATNRASGGTVLTGIVEALSNSVAGGQRQSLDMILNQPAIGDITRPGVIQVEKQLESDQVVPE